LFERKGVNDNGSSGLKAETRCVDDKVVVDGIL
jgi:hypothetical protein